MNKAQVKELVRKAAADMAFSVEPSPALSYECAYHITRAYSRLAENICEELDRIEAGDENPARNP